MDELRGIMRDFGRRKIAAIWQAYKKEETLQDSEEERLKNILIEHKEFYKYWDMASDLGDREVVTKEGVNPFLHVYFHLILENQIAQNEPSAVRETVENLVKKGVERHQVIHCLGEVLSNQIFNMLKYNIPFQEEEYISQIKKIESNW